MDARLNKAEQAFLRVLDGAICVFFTIMAIVFALGAILAVSLVQVLSALSEQSDALLLLIPVGI